MQTSRPDRLVNGVGHDVYFFGHFRNTSPFSQQLLRTFQRFTFQFRC